MFEYLKRHWIIVLVSVSIWGATIWTTLNKPQPIKIDENDTVFAKKDSVKLKVDSLVSKIDMKHKIALKKLEETEKKKQKAEELVILEKKKRLDKELEFKKRLEEPKQVKEVIKEKKVVVKDTELERKLCDYEEENKHLKEELNKTYLANQQLQQYQETYKVTSVKQDMIPDTIVKKKRRFNLFGR
jgi:hypothetical protein